MEFAGLYNAWLFWVQYGGKVGFGVRKHYFNMNKTRAKSPNQEVRKDA